MPILTSIASLNLGTQYLQQSYKVSDSFPFKWINKKWREGFYVTAMATAGSRWAIVMSRGAGFSDQVLLDYLDHCSLVMLCGRTKKLNNLFFLPGCGTRFSLS